MGNIRVSTAALTAAVREGRTVGQVLQPQAASLTRTAKSYAAARTKRDTGAYINGFRSHVEAGRSGSSVAKIVIENPVDYASYIEDGTRPHTIRARNQPYLTFKIGSKWVRVRQVKHPGTSPQHVIRDAVNDIANGRGR